VRQFDRVRFSEAEYGLGLQRAFQMQMQLGLRQRHDVTFAVCDQRVYQHGEQCGHDRR